MVEMILKVCPPEFSSSYEALREWLFIVHETIYYIFKLKITPLHEMIFKLILAITNYKVFGYKADSGDKLYESVADTNYPTMYNFQGSVH